MPLSPRAASAFVASRALKKRGVQVAHLADLGGGGGGVVFRGAGGGAAAGGASSSPSPCSARPRTPARGAAGAGRPAAEARTQARRRSRTPPRQNPDCKFGMSCRRAACWYRHPDGRELQPKTDGLSRLHTTEKKGNCVYGRRCRRPDCWFQHPEGRAIIFGKARSASSPSPQRPQARSPSRAGRRRSSSGSPPRRQPGLVRPCWRGVGCSRRGRGCPYDHPTVQSEWHTVERQVLARCNNGYFCTRLRCKYQHPEGRVGPAPQCNGTVSTRRVSRSPSRAPGGPPQDAPEGAEGGRASSARSESGGRPEGAGKKKRKSKKKKEEKKEKKAERKAKKATKRERTSRGRASRARSSSAGSRSGAAPDRSWRSASRPARRPSASRSARRSALGAARPSPEAARPRSAGRSGRLANLGAHNCRIEVGIWNDGEFGVGRRVIRIARAIWEDARFQENGGKTQVRGKGIGGKFEADEPLSLCIWCHDEALFDKAVGVAQAELRKVRRDYRTHCAYAYAGQMVPGAEPAPRAPAAGRGAGGSGSSGAAAQEASLDWRAPAADADDSFLALEMWQGHSAARRLQLMRRHAPGLLSDLHHPRAVLRRLDLRLALARRRAAAFVAELRGGLYDGICLRAPAPPAATAASEVSECEVAGHLRSPSRALDPSFGAVAFWRVPASDSAWGALEALGDLDGLVDFSLSAGPRQEEAPPPAARHVLARFASPAMALAALREAAPALRAALPGAAAPALLEPSARLRALVCQPAACRGREGADEALSARVVRHLDGLLGIEGEVTRAVLGRAGSQEQKLDVQVTYLRRVHHFCFYSARWCEDAWDLERRCGAVFLRGAAEDGEVEAPADAGPGEARERAIERFLGEARLERVEPCEPAEQEVASLCQQRTLTVAEGKYRCCECRKLFCGPEFVEKHLRRAHAELFEPLRRKAQEEAMCRAFSAHC